MTNRPEIFDQLVRLQIELWNDVDERLKAEHDLPISRLLFLRIIDARHGCRVNDIADDMVITIGGTSKIVDRLEQSGLVARRANPDDRRSSVIELTAAGEKVLTAANATFTAVLDERMPPSAGNLDSLLTTLTALRTGGAR
jgi:MarR family transcriptional regulator, organic hydroperoxide resistance regulator